MKRAIGIAILLAAIIAFALPGKASGQVSFNPDEIKGPTCVVSDSITRRSVVLSPAQSQYNVVVTDGYAHICLVQKFINPFSTISSVAYVFPLPHEGSVHAMAMEYRGQIYRAKIFERAQAQRLYDSVKTTGQNAALLLQERPNVFQQLLANIAPRDSAFIRIEVSLPLKYNGGEYELAIPTMIGERYQSSGSSSVPSSGTLWNPPENHEGQRLQVNVLVQTDFPITGLSSPTHPVIASTLPGLRAQLIERGVMSDTARTELAHNHGIVLTQATTYPNRDYVLRFKRTQASSDFTFASHYDRAYGKGHFALNLFPDDSLFEGARPDLDIVLLIDISGSQSGWPLTKEKEIALDILSRLKETDRFTVLSFSDNVSWAFGKQTPVWATPDSIRIAQRFIQGLYTTGGTQLLNGVKAALSAPPTAEHQRFYIFLTDGFITNEAAILDEIANHPTKPIVFTFGAGNSLNRHFLERCADVGNGFATEVTSSENVAPLVGRAWAKIDAPQLKNVQVSLGADVADVIMPRGTSLYLGSPLTVYGTYTGDGGPRSVVVKGRRNSEEITIQKTVVLASGWNMNYVLPQLWAKQRIEQLALAEGTSSVKKDSITGLSIEYQVLCKYTAFLAINPEQIRPQESIDQQLREAFSTSTKLEHISLAQLAVYCRKGLVVVTAPNGLFVEGIEVLDMTGRLVYRHTSKSGSRLTSFSWDGLTGRGRLKGGRYLVRVRLSDNRVVCRTVFWNPGRI